MPPGRTALPGTGIILNKGLLSTGSQGRALVSFSPNSGATLLQGTSVRFRHGEQGLVSESFSGARGVEATHSQGPVVTTSEYKIAGQAERNDLIRGHDACSGHFGDSTQWRGFHHGGG